MCREYCATNLPAVTSFVQIKIPQQIEVWEATFRDLAGDPCYLVRKSVASCIQEITRLLGMYALVLHSILYHTHTHTYTHAHTHSCIPN